MEPSKSAKSAKSAKKTTPKSLKKASPTKTPKIKKSIKKEPKIKKPKIKEPRVAYNCSRACDPCRTSHKRCVTNVRPCPNCIYGRREEECTDYQQLKQIRGNPKNKSKKYSIPEQLSQQLLSTINQPIIPTRMRYNCSRACDPCRTSHMRCVTNVRPCPNCINKHKEGECTDYHQLKRARNNGKKYPIAPEVTEQPQQLPSPQQLLETVPQISGEQEELEQVLLTWNWTKT